MVYDFVKEYESVPYAAHLKRGPIQVGHYICYRACIVVPVTDIAGRSPLNFFNLKFLLLCVCGIQMVLQYSNFGRTKALNACSLMAGECTFTFLLMNPSDWLALAVMVLICLSHFMLFWMVMPKCQLSLVCAHAIDIYARLFSAFVLTYILVIFRKSWFLFCCCWWWFEIYTDRITTNLRKCGCWNISVK